MSTYDLLVKGGQVAIPYVGTQKLDIGIRSGKIAAIGAGLALIALGGLLKATASTLTESATDTGGGGGGRVGGNTQSFLPEPEDIERQVGSEVNITVEGSLVQQDELGKFISDVISESNEKNGNVIVNPRFA